jgi:hypothetical protein
MRAAAALCALLVVGCNTDYDVSLPNGYFLARTYSGAVAVVAPSKKMVTRLSQRGVSAAVVGTLVAGCANPGDARNRHFFIVDTSSGRVWDDLSEMTYTRSLRSMGIEPPRLIPITRWTSPESLRARG